MNKVLSAFVALVVLAGTFFEVAAALEPVQLTIVSFSTPDSAHGRRWVRFEREIEQSLGDRVALTMLTGGQVGNEDNMLSNLRRGRAQMEIHLHRSVVGPGARAFYPFGSVSL